jgi:hypothetical protein
LDTLTGGVFTAPTSGERSARLREWLLTEPSLEHMQDVYKELSSRDKGAAKNLREKLDEIKKARGQDALAAEWAERAQQLLGSTRLNIADALAWQRDAAKAGAPLSREPLAGLKVQLAEVVKTVDDLQHQVMVQREAAVLLAQRVEVLSTKSWKEAQAVHASLQVDVAQWQQQAQDLTAQAGWPSVDMKFPPQLEASRNQLKGVWDAFEAALSQAHVAQTDHSAPLPQVLVWADELRALRGEVAVVAPAAEGEKQAKPAKPKLDPAQRQALREQATQAVLAVLTAVETEVTEGHGKASAGAATALRQVLKEHGRNLDTALDARVHAALTAAGELEGWQRWRADQLRQELVAKAEALFKPVVARKPKAPRVAAETAAAPADSDAHAGTEAPAAVDAVVDVTAAQDANLEVAVEAADVAAPEVTAEVAAEVSAAETAPETQDETVSLPAASSAAATAAEPAPAKIPAMGGRKMQETLRQLRDQWKLTDQGGNPNHALWKRFDAACNEAYKVVQEWLDKLKHEAVEHRGQRLAMMEELRAWGQAHAENTDWKLQLRTLHQFGDRWRNAGHLSEKAFAELQPQWKKVIQQAAAPLEAAQKASLERRQALIAEAEVLGAAPGLRVDAVKVLQQRWQTEAQAVPLERKLEQKLWESFRQPIDDAFNRKTVEREQVSSQISAHDRAVLDASRALETANASGDAQKIRAAMHGLDAALRGQAVAVAAEQAAASAPVTASAPVAAQADAQDSAPEHQAETTPVESAAPAAETAEVSDEAVAGTDTETESESEPAAPEVVVPAASVKAPPRPVVAVRGDDRPGQKRTELAPAGRGGKFGDRREGGRDGRPSDRGDRGGRPNDRFGDRFGDRAERPDRGPRLGDAAFRAQRDALEHAEMTLRKLASQAHGETLGNLMSAWETRQTEALPSAQDLGKGVNAATRSAWAQSVQAAPAPQAASKAALLRLEMAAEVPTPAEFLNERRALQLQLLTRRNEPGPVDTWRQDVGAVLASAHDGNSARRLQNVLKQLLKR